METNKENLSVDIIDTGTNAYICSLRREEQPCSQLLSSSRPSRSSGGGKKGEALGTRLREGIMPDVN